MAKNNKWNTQQFRAWEQTNFGLSIDPNYTGKDLLGFKPKSQHLHTKLPVFNKKKIRRIG